MSLQGLPPSARALIRTLPPLVKGYWRLGATFSPVPAVDPAFGATDLFVVLPLRDVEPRYLEHFGVEAIDAAARGLKRDRWRGIPFRAEFGYGERRPPIRRRPTMRP